MASTDFRVKNGLTVDTTAYIKQSLTVDTIATIKQSLTVGSGDQTASAIGGNIKGPDAAGTNVGGGNLNILGGTGTGANVGGSIVFKTAPASGVGGTTPNNVTTVMVIDSNGKVGIGNTSPVALLTLGLAGTTAGSLSLAGGTSGTATIQVSAAAGTPTLTLTTNTGTLLGTGDNIYIGTTSTSLGRTSANQALTGITSIAFPGSTSGTATLQATAIAGSPTLSLPTNTGTLVGTGDTGSVSNTMLAGSIANSKLSNSTITINSASTSLGSSVTLYAGTTALQTSSATQSLSGITGIDGGSSVSQALTIQSTTGIGTSDSIVFKVGNNGSTTAMTINTSGVAIHGAGEASATPVGNTIRAPSGTGTNIAGANLTITAGNGTGTGGSGSIVFQTAPIGSTGASANTMATVMSINPAGYVGFAGVNNLISTSTSFASGSLDGSAMLTWSNTTNNANWSFSGVDNRVFSIIIDNNSRVCLRSNGTLDIIGHTLPQTNNTYSLGSDSYRWSGVHATNFYRAGTRLPTFTTASSAPSSPIVGDCWYKSTSDIFYQYVNDGTSNFWLSLNTYPSSYANLAVTSTLTVAGTVSSNLVPTGNNVYNLGSASAYWGTVYGKATSAQYADLAEKYTADDNYEPGTVLEFGGTNEVTISNTDMSRKIAGIVSTNPGYLMNAELKSEFVVSLALTGRVPCKVQGTVRKGDMIVSASNGYARAEEDPKLGSVIGKALEDFDGITGIIEVVVGRL